MADGGFERSLSDQEWASLLHLWVDVARFARGDAESAVRHAVQRLGALLGAGAGGAQLLARGQKVADRSCHAVAGWKPGFALAMAADGRVLDDDIEARIRLGRYASDAGVKAVVAGVGRPRALLRADISSAERRPAGFEESLAAFGSADRVVAVHPMDGDLEVLLWFDRPLGAPSFSERDRLIVLEGLRGLMPLLRCLARWAGYIDCAEPLTPKERVVLRLLLTGKAEGDIAVELGMGRRSLHQRVTDIYRKFGVSSRPLLMALWLNSPQVGVPVVRKARRKRKAAASGAPKGTRPPCAVPYADAPPSRRVLSR